MSRASLVRLQNSTNYKVLYGYKMKFLVVLLVALVAVASGLDLKEIADANDRSISSEIVDAIEAWKLQMPCGFPGLGIPPLAPVKAEHRELAIDAGSFDIQGIVDKFRLNGLDFFDIVDFKVNAILSRVTFKFHWHNVNLNTLYDMLLSSKPDAAVRMQMKRNGGAKLTIKDFVVWGTAKYSTGLIGSGGVRLREFKMYASVGSVKSEIENLSNIKIINRKLNEIIEEWIMLAVNDNTENLADITDSLVVPLVNNMIGDMTIGDLIGAIGGGGGGEGEPVEKVPCVPQEV